MPIQVGNDTNTIPRVKVGNETIKRVYRGNELLYGLYDVHYYDRNNIDTYEPKEYAWGYVPECKTLPIPYNASTYFDTYWTHYGNSSGTNGWYTNSSLTTQKSGSVNKIDLNDKQDFDFFARWRQRRYQYDGEVSYDIYEYRYIPGSGGGGDDPGGGGDDPGGGGGGNYPSPPAAGTSCNDLNGLYYDLTSSSDVKGQCVWYANGRTAEMRGLANYNANRDGPGGAPKGNRHFSSAAAWKNDHSSPWYFTTNKNEAQVGDVAIFNGYGGYGHVVVIESKTNDNSWVISQANYGSYSMKPAGTMNWTPGTNSIDGNLTFLGYLCNHTQPIL